MPIVFYSFPLGLATRIPEAAAGFCRNEIPAVRQRNQVHHLPGESEKLFYEQTSYSCLHNFLAFSLSQKLYCLLCWNHMVNEDKFPEAMVKTIGTDLMRYKTGIPKAFVKDFWSVP